MPLRARKPTKSKPPARRPLVQPNMIRRSMAHPARPGVYVIPGPRIVGD